MTRTISIGQETWERMQKYAVPLEDTPDTVVQRLLDLADQAGRSAPAVLEQIPLAPIGKPAQSPQKRLPRGLKLPEADYVAPILSCLYERDGQGSFSEVMESVGEKLSSRFTSVDHEMLVSGEIRWRKQAAWTLYSLKQNNYVSNPHRGTWRLTHKGEEAVESRKFPKRLPRVAR